MLRISKLTDYSIVVMVELNQNHGKVVSAHALASHTGLELPTVSKVLKLLTRAGLVQSFRGASGGYLMDRAARKVSVGEIIAAIEGPIAMTECSVEEVGLCSQEQVCSLRSNWQTDQFRSRPGHGRGHAGRDVAPHPQGGVGTQNRIPEHAPTH